MTLSFLDYVAIIVIATFCLVIIYYMLEVIFQQITRMERKIFQQTKEIEKIRSEMIELLFAEEESGK